MKMRINEQKKEEQDISGEEGVEVKKEFGERI